MAFSLLLHRASSSSSSSSSSLIHRNFGAQFLQFLQFSTTVTNNNLVSVIQSQIDSSESPYQRWIPNGAENDHPFQITGKYEEEDGKIVFIFTRQSRQYHKYEETTLQVCEDAYDQVITADDVTPNVLPIVGSFRTGYLSLDFEATAEPKMIHVHTLKMSDIGSTDKLQFLEDYLGTRGINATMTDILFDGFRRND